MEFENIKKYKWIIIIVIVISVITGLIIYYKKRNVVAIINMKSLSNTQNNCREWHVHENKLDMILQLSDDKCSGISIEVKANYQVEIFIGTTSVGLFNEGIHDISNLKVNNFKVSKINTITSNPETTK